MRPASDVTVGALAGGVYRGLLYNDSLSGARYTHLVGLMSAKVTPLLRASFFTVAGLVRTATVLKRLALYSLSMFYIYFFLLIPIFYELRLTTFY